MLMTASRDARCIASTARSEASCAWLQYKMPTIVADNGIITSRNVATMPGRNRTRHRGFRP